MRLLALPLLACALLTAAAFGALELAVALWRKDSVWPRGEPPTPRGRADSEWPFDAWRDVQ